MDDSFEKRGVSLALMEAVSAFALGQNAEPGYWTIGRLGALIVGNHEILKAGNRWGVAEGDEGEAARLATLTFGEKCSLIDVLERHHRETPHPILGLTYGQSVSEGKANVFMSFAYAADYSELVDAARCWLEGEGEGAAQTTFFWFDLFVNNQWVALERDFLWWSTTFRTAIQDIGRTVLVLLPWNAPIPLTRAWCLYEIHCSANLSIALSREQQRAFYEQLLTVDGVDEINMALSKIDLAKASAFLPEDKARIFEAVGDGIHEFNTKILAMLRDWLADTAKKVMLQGEVGAHADDAFGRLDGCAYSAFGHVAELSQVASLLFEQDKLDEAAELYERAIVECEARLEQIHAEGDTLRKQVADAQKQAASLQQGSEDRHDAEVQMSPHLAEKDRALGQQLRVFRALTLGAINDLALVRRNQGRLGEAADLFERSLAGKEAHPSLGPLHSDTLITVNNLAGLRFRQGKFDQAGELYERARVGLEAELGLTHPSTLNVVNNLGILRAQQGRLDEAEELWGRALSGYEAQLGPSHPQTLCVVMNLAGLLADQGRPGDALVLATRAASGFKEQLGHAHEKTLTAEKQKAVIVSSLSRVKDTLGK